MNKSLKIFVETIFSVSVFQSVSLASTIYYVDPNGSDIAGNGSKNYPWKTLSHVCSQAQENQGNIIYLNSGLFIETRSSIVPLGVNIMGKGPDSTIIISTLNDWVIKLESSSITDGNQSLSNFTIDGQNRQLAHGILVKARHNISIKYLNFKEIDNIGLQITSEYQRDDHILPSTYLTGIEVYNCSFTNCAKDFSDYGWSSGCLQIGHLADASIHEITIDEDRGYGIKYCEGGWLKGTKIFNNNITVPSYDPVWGSDIAIEIWHLYDDCEVYNNTTNNWLSFIYGNKGSGARSVNVYGNTIIFERPDNDNEGIEIGHGLSDVEVFNNYLKNPRYGVVMWGEPGQDQSNIVIHHNVFYNHLIGEGVLLEPSNAATYSNIKIYNNTFDRLSAGVVINNRGNTQSTEIINNIIMNSEFGVLTMGEASQIQNTIIAYNVFYNVDQIYVELGEHTTNTSFENNLKLNPQLWSNGKRPAPYYRPMDYSSAVVDAGLDVGLPYLGKRPDIGAYEYEMLSSILQISEVKTNRIKRDIGTTGDPKRGVDLKPIYPNPFNAKGTIEFSIFRKCRVSIKIYNIKGRAIKNIIDEDKEAGTYKVEWDGRDDSGKLISSGIYFCQMIADNIKQMRKWILQK